MKNIKYPLNDDRGYVKLLYVQGSDLEIVNDAHVSYEKESKHFDEKDLRLLNTLISGIDEPQHTSPLRGCSLKFEVKCPLFVRNQWWKHHVASAYTEGQDGWNEKSYRYRSLDENDFYVPEILPGQNPVNKQASDYENLPKADQSTLKTWYVDSIMRSIREYNRLLSAGVSREIARALLPTGVYTLFRWTVSLHAFLNFWDLRHGHGAQSEISKYCDAMVGLASPSFCFTFDIWSDRRDVINEAMELYRGEKCF
jgi:thymidylate synthase (FAD)